MSRIRVPKIKKSTKQYIAVALVSVLVVAVTGGVAYKVNMSRMERSYKSVISDYKEQLASHQRVAYVAKKAIKAGTEIRKEDVEEKIVYVDVEQKQIMRESDIGNLALVDIQASIPILQSMLTANVVTDSEREMEFGSILLNSNLQDADFVDVRLRFANGEDFIVLSKKNIKNVNLETNNCFFKLNEEEILLISGAIIDAFLHEGSQLYTTKYIESAIQGKSSVTYSPNTHIISLIETDPNILTKAESNLSRANRKALEKRLKSFETDGKADIVKNKNAETNKKVDDWGTESTETATTENSTVEDNYEVPETTTEATTEGVADVGDNYYDDLSDVADDSTTDENTIDPEAVDYVN